MLGENNPDLTILSRIQKPVIAAVNGLAFGGGCEIAMSCDIIWASDRAQFGQPEVKVGLLPGLGGTQRLTRCVGKPLAMELCLTGRPMNAKEAKEAGLVARVVPHENLLVETIKLAEEIASKSSTVIKLIKEAVNRSQEVSLSEGLLFERRMFQAGLALVSL
jgi:enoyl-CoA hydratase/carnithine racemase